MRILARFRSLWRDVTRRDAVERDLDDELQAYVELLVAEKVRDGVSPDAARRAAAGQLPAAVSAFVYALGGRARVRQGVRSIADAPRRCGRIGVHRRSLAFILSAAKDLPAKHV